MKLKPREGVDDLRFGDDLEVAKRMFIDVPEIRTHPDVRSRTSAHFRAKGLALGFDANGRLVFIAALRGGEGVELWGDRPFDLARDRSDLKAWIEQKGHRVEPHMDCLGMRFDIREQRVAFCFSAEDFETLEGIQLYDV